MGCIDGGDIGEITSLAARCGGCLVLCFCPLTGHFRLATVLPPAMAGFGPAVPPSAGCPVPKAAPAAACSSPDPGRAPWRTRIPPLLQEGVPHLRPHRCLVSLRQCFPAVRSSFRRCPGRIATCQSTSRPRFSFRFLTPRYPASPHTWDSPPWSGRCASVTSCTLAPVVVKMCTTPVSESTSIPELPILPVRIRCRAR